MEFLGYRREDGGVGVRNHVAIIPAMPYALPVARAIVQYVKGTTLVEHLNGRGQSADDLEFTFRTLEGVARNGNVGATLVVGFEPTGPAKLAERISASGKPVDQLAIVGQGSLRTLERGARLASQMVQHVSRTAPEPFDAAELFVGAECGGSDATSGIVSNPALGGAMDRLVERGGTVTFNEVQEIIGAEAGLAERAANEGVARRIYEITEKAVFEARAAGVDITEANPAPDNVAGGITTLEEKSLGAVQKGGTTTVQSVLDFGEAPSCPGLHVMDAPAPAAESMAAMAAAGCQIIVFTTGKGNPSGTPVVPVLKVSANPQTVVDSADNIDVDLSDVITQGTTLETAASRIWDEIVAVGRGMRTKAEILGHDEFNITRIGPSL